MGGQGREGGRERKGRQRSANPCSCSRRTSSGAKFHQQPALEKLHPGPPAALCGTKFANAATCAGMRETFLNGRAWRGFLGFPRLLCCRALSLSLSLSLGGPRRDRRRFARCWPRPPRRKSACVHPSRAGEIGRAGPSGCRVSPGLSTQLPSFRTALPAYRTLLDPIHRDTATLGATGSTVRESAWTAHKSPRPAYLLRAEFGRRCRARNLLLVTISQRTIPPGRSVKRAVWYGWLTLKLLFRNTDSRA